MTEQQPLVLDSYARQSHRQAAQRAVDMSIGGQHEVNLRRIREYRDGQGRTAQLGKKLDDPKKSAWNPDVVREDWEELMRRLESGESDGVVIFDVERFVRQMADAVRIADMAKKALVLDSDQEYDLTTPSGRKSFLDAANAAEYYGNRLSSRVRRGYALRRRDQMGSPGGTRPYGHEQDATTVREDEAVHIRAMLDKILEVRDEKDPYTQVAEYANERGARTVMGEPWNADKVRFLLIQPRIAGYLTYQGEIVGNLKGDPIAEPTKWQDYMRWQSSRTRTSAINVRSLGSWVLTCGDDGGGVTSVPAQTKSTNPDGTPRRKYRCKAKGCQKTLGDEREVDHFLREVTVAQLSDPKHVRQLQKLAEDQRAARGPHEEELHRLEGLLDHWDDQLNNGKIDVRRHERMVNDVQTRIEKEQERLEAAGEDIELPHDEVLIDVASTWDNATNNRIRKDLIEQAFPGYELVLDPGSIDDFDIASRLHFRPLPQGNGRGRP